jgi:glycosyltransferase involved in cell wall biosynthesis
MLVSLILSSFKRPHLLNLGLYSIFKYKLTYLLEIIVVNDGLEDGTKEICDKYRNLGLDINYIFSGQRNLKSIKNRVSGFALNIGIKQSKGDIVILSCPEIFHLNNALEILVDNLISNPRSMVIPNSMYFDQKGMVTEQLIELEDSIIDYNLLSLNETHVQMPYLMALYKKYLVEIGGYDEDFIGYAADDNDLIDRLKLKGLTHLRTEAKIIHLYHGGTGDGYSHPENPDWVYNYNLYKIRKGVIVRNEGLEWGILK